MILMKCRYFEEILDDRERRRECIGNVRFKKRIEKKNLVDTLDDLPEQVHQNLWIGKETCGTRFIIVIRTLIMLIPMTAV